MNTEIIAVSKSWNRAEIINGTMVVDWDSETGFDILEYQVRDESDEIVFRAEDEEAVIKWFANQKRVAAADIQDRF